MDISYSILKTKYKKLVVIFYLTWFKSSAFNTQKNEWKHGLETIS